ncbi:MAG: hypothetical protein IKZ35_01100 [Clostridia bacterium]|nr:hypothetical protein [Oscillospiraceae bacterium]MBR4892564.1 hypothetical protein [Clostridia bacterium]
MQKKDRVLYYATDKEERLLLSHIFDNYVKSVTKNHNTYSNFFSEEKTLLIESAFGNECDVKFDTYGGYQGAERVISAFLVNEEKKAYPIKCLEITGRDIKKLSHRDFLGALMSLGIERDTVGDIIISDKCYVFVKEEIADYIIFNLSKVGNVGVSVLEYLGEEIVREEKSEILTVTVESLRLDLILSKAFNIKRSDSVKYIAAGKATVSARTVTANDYKVKENDKITLKGKGKVLFLGEKGQSKKGKIIVSIKKYL